MAFEKYTWKDRIVQFVGRRRLINTEDELDVEAVDITRSPTSVTETGDRFNAQNMNDLEDRIANAFSVIDNLIAHQFDTIYPIGAIYQSFSNTNPQILFPGTAWTKLPDNRVLVPSTTPGQYVGNSGTTLTKQATGSVSLTGTVKGANADLPPHVHRYYDKYGYIASENFPKSNPSISSTSYNFFHVTGNLSAQVRNTDAHGGGQPHNHEFGPVYASFSGNNVNIDIRQPYTTIYAWRRTA